MRVYFVQLKWIEIIELVWDNRQHRKTKDEVLRNIYRVKIHHEESKNMILQHGRPKDVNNRLEKEIRTYDLLDALGIKYERADHKAAKTMEDCKLVDEMLAPAVICKNLFLSNAQKTKFYLLMIREDKKFRTKDISKQINSSRLSFAPESYMNEYLDITPGAVSVLGLMNDKDCKVQLLVDKDIFEAEYFGCHPCVNTSSLKVKTMDIFDSFLKAVKHRYIVVNVMDDADCN